MARTAEEDRSEAEWAGESGACLLGGPRSRIGGAVPKTRQATRQRGPSHPSPSERGTEGVGMLQARRLEDPDSDPLPEGEGAVRPAHRFLGTTPQNRSMS